MYKLLPSFERLSEMALQDPDALERLRKEYIEAAINAAPEPYRNRLEGLQFQIDGQRRTSSNPMSACINISKMMHESLNQLRSFIDGDVEPEDNSEEATILSFPQPSF